MAFSSCLSLPLISLKPVGTWRNVGVDQRLTSPLKSMNTELFGQQVAGIGSNLRREWSFARGSRIVVRPQVATFIHHKKASGIHASWLANSQIASSVFTLGTVAVLPFYTLMVFAPKAELTKKSMESSIPYVVLGLLYAYLLYLSWSPDTLRTMFASKYWLPELPGIAKMFSSEMTLASAWIHLLGVDLFAARFFMMGLKIKLKLATLFLFASFFVPLEFLLMSSPKQ
ncbi:hypothetical protein Pint_18773 [Pistacia integerrima]|uniref:Uncharacterized protein n=1 Tax=Pistacia integerrima TaxID=434235 RepID=A0ACC0YU64_9ROSI|nr:hypothetical protein Pint_18773 [Pistacia integerrima]